MSVSKEEDSALLYIVAAVVGLVGLFIVLRAIRGSFHSGTKKKKGGLIGKRRTGFLLFGLCNAGKSRLFSLLVSRIALATHTSMTPNEGTVTLTDPESNRSVSANITDFPGHRRLRKDLLTHVEGAIVLVLVVDATTVADTRDEGAQAIAEVLLEVATANETRGIKHILVACNKRDNITAYSAKAVRRQLGIALKQLLASKQGDMASVGKHGTNSVASAAEELLPLTAAGDAVDFDQAAFQFTFVDCSAIGPAEDGEPPAFGVDDLVKAMISSL